MGSRLPEIVGAASEHQWPRYGGVGTAIESLTFSDRPPPLGRPELAESHDFRWMFTEFHRSSSLIFSFVSSPNNRARHQRSSRPQEGPSKGPISSDHQ
ncbi:hypothetical protein Prudu_487S000300 [Prunus dulcis]|uniref:Uncharacterized protein n=1 Tax=Prunus dulcis TaxID=3755 RepID=A0A5H2XK66_PRUDU|nr:hypothetical protein Prudu_487S000300 [Prunus dulcis]